MAVCLIQLGRFLDAVDAINTALHLARDNEFSYKFDLFQLRGVCAFR